VGTGPRGTIGAGPEARAGAARIEALLRAVAAWAAAEPRVAAVALVGSHARGAARPDSDVDLVVLADEVEAFVSDASWVSSFGVPRARAL
jgi:tRNA nucleotidyltransferase (CCA-adding enzyme)